MSRNRFLTVIACSLTCGILTAPSVLRADDPKPQTPSRPQTPARPQTPGRFGPGRAGANFDPLSRLKSAVDDLKLREDKKTKADEIIARAKADSEKSMKDGGDRDAVNTIARAATEDITALLDEDQKLMFETKMKALANAAPQGGPGGQGAPGGPGGVGGPGRPGAAGRGPAQIGQRIKQATASLNLSDEQNKKVDALVVDLQKKTEELRGGQPSPEMRQKMQAMREDMMTQMKSILSEEQFKRFQETMQQGPGGQGGPGGPGGARLGGMLERLQENMKELNLNDDQKEKIKTVFADTQPRLQELVQQVQGGQPNPETREKLRGVFEDLRTQIAAVLTDEQKEKFRGLVQQQGPGNRRPGQGNDGDRPRRPGGDRPGGEKPGGDKPAPDKI